MRKHYVLTSTDSEKLVGPAIIGWYCDYAALAMKDGRFRPSTVTVRGTSLLKSLNVIKGLREDRLLRLEDVRHRVERSNLLGETSKETPEGMEGQIKAVEKIYGVPFSAHRQKGWAVYFNFADLQTVCFDASRVVLSRCRFRAWEWCELELAASWMEEEISKINERVAVKRRLMMTPQVEVAREVFREEPLAADVQPEAEDIESSIGCAGERKKSRTA